jgi:AcrR family transcriptional regulator
VIPKAERPASARSRQQPISALPEHDRRRLLAAVVEPFGSQGYRAASVESICCASGIDRRLFGHLFVDKDDCFLAAFDEIACEAREEIAAAVPVRTAWPDQLATALKVLLDLIDANPGPSRLVLVEARDAPNPIFGRYVALVESLAPFFAEARRDADPRLPEMLDSTLPSGVAWMLGAHLAAGRPAPVSTLFAEALRFLAMPYLDNDELDELIAAHRFPPATRPD